jgi:hypothetical protein
LKDQSTKKLSQKMVGFTDPKGLFASTGAPGGAVAGYSAAGGLSLAAGRG